ncbi:spermidine synthase [Bdellovibrio sp. HCB337]|uniref:spermidine synthase n=1 Tax=Bdellovibrio sp. HCB337 TaxID=3394358 RepID=UPI0039A70F53
MNISSRSQKYYALLLAFIAGFLSLSIEVLGTQIAFSFYASSSEALAVSLCAFLTGLATASWLSHRYNEIFLRSFEKLMVWILFTLSILIGVVLAHFDSLQLNLIRFSSSISGSHNLFNVGFGVLCFLYLFIPAVLIGILFPLANDRLSKVGISTGKVNLIDLIGAVAGTLLTGFVFIPYLGVSRSFALISFVSLAAGFLISIQISRKYQLGSLFIFLVLAPFAKTVYETKYVTVTNPTAEILYQEDSKFGKVTIIKNQVGMTENKELFINYRIMCRTSVRLAEDSLASLSFLKVEQPHLNVLNVGLGCGFTASTVLKSHQDLQLDIAEINEKVAKGAATYFRKENNAVLEDPRVRLIIEDGYNVLKTSSKTYNRIFIDIEEPTIIQSSALFTEDGMKLAKQRLAKDGVFGLWSFDQKETAKIILNTMRRQWKYAAVYPIAESLVYFASDHELPEATEITDVNRRKEIEDVPLDLVATVTDNPYPRYFDVNKVMHIPPENQEPNEMKPAQ